MASFPAKNPALTQIASQIASNQLRQRRLMIFEAELLAAAGRTMGDIPHLTPEQAHELEIAADAHAVLMWIAKEKTAELGDDPRVATFDDTSEAEPETIGRYLHHALLDELHKRAPELVAEPLPTSAAEWDTRIQAILDACFHDYDEIVEWVIDVGHAERQAAEADLLREFSAERATDDVMTKVTLIRARQVREERSLIECYRGIDQVTSAN